MSAGDYQGDATATRPLPGYPGQVATATGGGGMAGLCSQPIWAGMCVIGDCQQRYLAIQQHPMALVRCRPDTAHRTGG
jgi:hypothetical protein